MAKFNPQYDIKGNFKGYEQTPDFLAFMREETQYSILLKELDSLEKKIRNVEFRLEEKISDERVTVKEMIEHLKNLKGEKGDMPIKDELLNLIIPLIPPAKEGEPGKNYILTEADKKSIAQKIKIPVVEKIIEKKEVLQPIITKEIINEIKEITETPEQIAQKLNTLNDVLDIKVIKGLERILDTKAGVTFGKKVKVGGSGSYGVPVFGEELTGSGTAFTLANTPNSGTVQLYKGGSRLLIGASEDFTISGRNITLAISKNVNEKLLADYLYTR